MCSGSNSSESSFISGARSIITLPTHNRVYVTGDYIACATCSLPAFLFIACAVHRVGFLLVGESANPSDVFNARLIVKHGWMDG